MHPNSNSSATRRHASSADRIPDSVGLQRTLGRAAHRFGNQNRAELTTSATGTRHGVEALNSTDGKVALATATLLTGPGLELSAMPVQLS